MDFRGDSKGITLIALVITIIVLLILAGVSLSLVAGGDGILGRAESAVDANKLATAKEEAELLIAEKRTEWYEKKYVKGESVGRFKEYLGKELESGETTNSGNKVTVDTSGNIVIKDENRNTVITGTLDDNEKLVWGNSTTEGTTPTTPTTPTYTTLASQIDENNYGDYVDLGTSLIVNDNIVLEDGSAPTTDWRIFHKDASGGVYLILADYLPYSYETSSTAGSSTGLGTGLLNAGTDYPYNWRSSISRVDLLTRLKDTNSWNKLLSSSYIAKGIAVRGAVDLETWVASWNAKKYTKLYIATTSMSDGLNGYYIGTSEDPATTEQNLSSTIGTGYGDTLYFSHKNTTSRSNANAYWLVSPSAKNTNCVMRVSYNGVMCEGSYTNLYIYGVRPAVYIPAGINAEKLDGVWKIK